MNRTRRRASIALLLALAPSASLAATQNITWTGGSTTGNWEDPSKWSPNVIPNNTGLTTYNVLIDNGALSAADVRFNTPEFGPEFYTVDSLTISSGDRLTWPQYYQAAANLTALNATTINGIATIQNGTLHLGANQTLLGTGTLSLGQGGRIDATSGTLTLGASLSVQSQPGTSTIGLASQPLVNLAPVSASSSGMITLAGSTISNLGSLNASNGGIIAINTPFTQLSDLGTWSNTGGRFRIANTLDNTGRTFALNTATGDWELTGTLRNGTLTTANDTTLHVPFGTTSVAPAILDNVQVNGQLAVDGPVPGLGETGYAGYLRLPGDQALTGTGTVVLNGLGWIKNTFGTFVIGPQLTVSGGNNSNSSSNGLGDEARPTVNQGHVIANLPGPLVISGSSLLNQGTFEVANNGILAFAGIFTRADLGTLINNGGTFRILGTLDNTGQLFRIDNANPSWELAGTIKNGTIETSDGKQLLIIRNYYSSPVATLDNVRVNGSIRIADSSATLNIPAGQTLHGSGEIVFSSILQTIKGDGGLTIASGMTIRGPDGDIGNDSTPTINHGTIWADSNVGTFPALDIYGASFFSDGLIRTSPGAVVQVRANVTRAQLGSIDNAGTISIRGTLDNTGQVFALDASTGKWQLNNGGTLRGGTLTTSQGNALLIGQNGGTLDGVTILGNLSFGSTLTLRNTTLVTPLSIVFPARVTLDNVLVNAPLDITFQGGGNIIMSPGQPLSGSGTLTLGGNSSITAASGTLIIGPGITARGGGKYFLSGGYSTSQIGAANSFGPSAPLINQGLISVESLKEITLNGTTITNTGIFDLPDSARLTARGNLLFGPSGTLNVELGPDTLNGFLAVTGNLDLTALNDAATFTLTASDLAPQVFITYIGTLQGTFDQITPGFLLDYSTPHQIKVSVIPEPSFLFASLLAPATLLLRRRPFRSP